jgi:hypothetical protein
VVSPKNNERLKERGHRLKISRIPKAQSSVFVAVGVDVRDDRDAPILAHGEEKEGEDREVIASQAYANENEK